MNHDIVCGWMGPRFFVGKKYGSDCCSSTRWTAPSATSTNVYRAATTGTP